MRVYRDRREAAGALADLLRDYAGREDVIVLGLPRGGAPVAAEVARVLGVPWDLLLVRKLGVPGQEELALGAVAADGTRVLNDRVLRTLHLPPPVVEGVTADALAELARREALYRGGSPPPEVRGRVVVLVDDGVATGATMRAAVEVVRHWGATRVVVAVPTAPRETCAELGELADACLCADVPEPFWAVGASYEDFSQVSDDEVRELLAAGRRAAPS